MNEFTFNDVAEPEAKEGGFLNTLKEFWNYSTKGINPEFEEHRANSIQDCFMMAFAAAGDNTPEALEKAIRAVIKENKAFGNKWANRDKVTMFSWGDFDVKDVLDYQKNMTQEQKKAALDARAAYQSKTTVATLEA